MFTTPTGEPLRAPTSPEGFQKLEITQLQQKWKRMLGKVRTDAASAKLVQLLIVNPVVTVVTAQKALSVSNEAARLALLKFEKAGILQEQEGTNYARVWLARDVFELLGDFHYAIDAGSWPEGLRRIRAPVQAPTSASSENLSTTRYR